MRAVMAGWSAGYLLAVLSTIVLTYLVFKDKTGEVIGRWLDPEVSKALVTVPLLLGTTIALTEVGVVLGIIYEVAHFSQHFWAWFMLMFAVSWIHLPPMVMFFRSHWKLWVFMSLSFLLLFADFMPYLASRG